MDKLHDITEKLLGFDPDKVIVSPHKLTDAALDFKHSSISEDYKKYVVVDSAAKMKIEKPITRPTFTVQDVKNFVQQMTKNSKPEPVLLPEYPLPMIETPPKPTPSAAQLLKQAELDRVDRINRGKHYISRDRATTARIAKRKAKKKAMKKRR